MRNILILLIILCLGMGQKLMAATYYSKASGSATVLANWTDNTGGTGAIPSSFVNNKDSFIIQVGHIMTVTSNWTVLSTGNGVGNNGDLRIEAGSILLVSATLTIGGNPLNTVTVLGNLILESTTTAKGYLVDDTDASINNVTQKRYLTSNQRGWRLLSNPLSTITFGALASGSTTPFTLGANASGAYNSSTNSWSNGVDTDNMNSLNAYKVFIRGRNTEVTGLTYSVQPPSNVTVAIKGTAANAVPTAISTVVGKFYLLANPYTAPVSVSSILAASTGLSTTVSYYNPTLGSSGSGTDLEKKFGGYNAITVSGAAGSATDVVLPPMGAIFVQATTAGTINLPKTVVYTGVVSSGNYSHRIANIKVDAPTALTINVDSKGVNYDNLQLQFKEGGTLGNNIDFGKLPNTVLDFYSISEVNNYMAISELELKEQIIPLGVTSTVSQDFSLKITENTIPTGFEAVLIDKLSNTETVLIKGTAYDFSINNTTNSQGNERFSIVLRTSGSLAVKKEELDSKISVYPNPAHNQLNIVNNKEGEDANYKIYAINGQLIHSENAVSGSTTTIKVNTWAPGIYLLKATQSGNEITKQLIIK